jgi:hypothetical protein
MSTQPGYTYLIVLHCSTTSERTLQDDQRSFHVIEHLLAHLIHREEYGMLHIAIHCQPMRAGHSEE